MTVVQNGSGTHDRARRRRKCIGKYAYDDPYDALREMFALPYRKEDLTEYDLSLYRCEYCDYWHLGTLNRAYKKIEVTPVPVQVQGQMVIPYPELRDYNTGGYRNTKRNGEAYR